LLPFFFNLLLLPARLSLLVILFLYIFYPHHTMTCIAPTSDPIFHKEKYFQPIPERISWVRKHHIETEFYSDEELHPEYSHEKQSIDRLKEIQDLSMRATLLNAEHRYSEEPITPRKRRLTEYNSPDRNEPYLPPHPAAATVDQESRFKLTLSQFASSASEQEPLYPDDEDVEEILMRLRHGHDYYRPQSAPSFPMLFPHQQMRSSFYPMDPHQRMLPPHLPPPTNKGSLFHILSQEDHHAHSGSIHHHPHHMHPANNLHMRRLFFEDGLVESSDEDLEHPKKKIRRDGKAKSPLKSIVVGGNDDVQEKEHVAAGLCFKTHKPKVQREYYYAKLSKTIFRWTCCGSQAKTHPDA